jgi:hypothetical protein
MLVRQHQAEVVAAGLDQDLVEALGEVRVVLELVQVEVEVGLQTSGRPAAPSPPARRGRP